VAGDTEIVTLTLFVWPTTGWPGDPD